MFIYTPVGNRAPYPSIFLGMKEARWELEGRPGGQREQEGPEARTEAVGWGGAGSFHTGASTSSSSLLNLTCVASP